MDNLHACFAHQIIRISSEAESLFQTANSREEVIELYKIIMIEIACRANSIVEEVSMDEP